MQRKAEISGVKELLIKFCKGEKTKEKLITLLPDIPEKPLMHILGFKKNQTLQVLEAEIAI